jgi:ornithine cyclodeaminase
MGLPDGIRYLNRADVVRAAGGLDPVAIIREALTLHAEGRTTLPDEAYLRWSASDGSFARSLTLPGALWGERPAIGVKMINSSLGNPGRRLPRAQGLTALFDLDTAYPVALLEGAYLSALRTSGYTALSVLLLGRGHLGKIAVIGCGALADAHVRLLASRFPDVWFSLYDEIPQRHDDLVAALAADGFDCRPVASAEDAVREAAVVITTTTTTVGYLPFRWLAPGALVAHVSLDDVLPDVVAQCALLIVDDWRLVSADDRRLLGRMFRSGDLLGPKGEPYARIGSAARKVDAELADVVTGRHPGRASADQIILSNPFGMGILDVALAAEVLRAAERDGIGTMLSR